MSKEYLKNSWCKLDNIAKAFALDDKMNTNIFRYSVILKQDVDETILMQALKKSLDCYLVFKVKIGTGLFWNYLEFNPKEPLIHEENEIPCQHINFKKNNDYLFKITYYKKKINLDVFHVLTDGTGAIEFFKSIIYHYLNLKHHLSFYEAVDHDQCYQDQSLKNYDKNLKNSAYFHKIYMLPGKVNKNINNTYHYIIDMNDVKCVCKKYGVTVTEYFTALYVYAIYLSIYKKKSKKEIVITVPVNLRKYYQVDTLSNFFVCIHINPKISEKNLTTFEEILNEVHNEFQEKLNENKIKEYLARDVKLGKNIPIRLIPLFLKKKFMKYIGTFVSNSATSTLSNVGSIDIDDRYKIYIDNILALVMPGRMQKIKCTICSFDQKLNVTINSNIDDLKFESTFYQLLCSQVHNVKVESNNPVDFL